MDEQIEEQIEPQPEPEQTTEPEQEGNKTPKYLNLILGGILLLLIGAFLGYIGRGTFGPEAQAAKATSTAAAVVVQTRAATNKQVMELVSQQITHWRGDANAPITMIEISDYQ